MGSKAWGLVTFMVLASASPVHALFISARRRRGDARARIAPDAYRDAGVRDDERF